MTLNILLTGATDGIGQDAANRLSELGHMVLLHGRSAEKLAAVSAAMTGPHKTFQADLSDLDEVKSLAGHIRTEFDRLDVIINNAGVFKTGKTDTKHGIDIRFVVNYLAPYVLSQDLFKLLPKTGRLINVSSAAQAPVDLAALKGQQSLSHGSAYAQSKLAITMWSSQLARSLPDGPVVMSVNPASLIGTKMVKEGYGIAGKDIGIGGEILTRLAVSSEFSDTSGIYFDNDIGEIGTPHPDALDTAKCEDLIEFTDTLLQNLT